MKIKYAVIINTSYKIPVLLVNKISSATLKNKEPSSYSDHFNTCIHYFNHSYSFKEFLKLIARLMYLNTK